MGRKRTLSALQEDEARLLKLSGMRTPAIAERFGVSARTIDRMLLRKGIRIKRGRKPGEHFSQFAKWLGAHPGTILPRSIRKVAELSSCSPTSVKLYLYRRRKALRKKALTLDFRKLFVRCRDIRGRIIPARAIAEYRLSVESWTHAVRLSCTLKAGAGIAVLRFPASFVERHYSSMLPTSTSESQLAVGVPPVMDKNADQASPASAS